VDRAAGHGWLTTLAETASGVQELGRETSFDLVDVDLALPRDGRARTSGRVGCGARVDPVESMREAIGQGCAPPDLPAIPGVVADQVSVPYCVSLN
jgi:hypothetical protein